MQRTVKKFCFLALSAGRASPHKQHQYGFYGTGTALEGNAQLPVPPMPPVRVFIDKKTSEFGDTRKMEMEHSLFLILDLSVLMSAGYRLNMEKETLN